MSQVLNTTLKQIRDEFVKYQPIITEEDLFWELILGDLDESTISIGCSASKEVRQQLPVLRVKNAL